MKPIRKKFGKFVVLATDKNGARFRLRANHTFARSGMPLKFTTLALAKRSAKGLLQRHPELYNFKVTVEPYKGFKAALKNPSAYSSATEKYAQELDKSAQAYEAFTGARATHLETFKTPAIHAGFALGKLVAVMYRATRDGETNVYRHDFEKISQPLLIAKDDGSALGIVGGRFTVTERGIEDV